MTKLFFLFILSFVLSSGIPQVGQADNALKECYLRIKDQTKRQLPRTGDRKEAWKSVCKLINQVFDPSRHGECYALDTFDVCQKAMPGCKTIINNKRNSYSKVALRCQKPPSDQPREETVLTFKPPTINWDNEDGDPAKPATAPAARIPASESLPQVPGS